MFEDASLYLLPLLSSSSSSSSSLSDRSKGNKTEIDRIVEDLKKLRSLIVSEEEQSNARFAQIIAPLPAEHCSTLTDGELSQRFLTSMRTGTSFLASTERPLTLSGQDKRRKRSSLDDPGVKQENKERRRRRESVCLTRGPVRNNVVEHAVAVSLKGIDSSYLELVIPCSLHKLDDDLFPVPFSSCSFYLLAATSSPLLSSILSLSRPQSFHLLLFTSSSDGQQVMLFAELLSRSEGPLWNRIRGKGLAYHSLLEVPRSLLPPPSFLLPSAFSSLSLLSLPFCSLCPLLSTSSPPCTLVRLSRLPPPLLPSSSSFLLPHFSELLSLLHRSYPSH